MNAAQFWIAAALVCGLLAYSGYEIGHGRAEAEGRAALNVLKAERAEEQRADDDAYGRHLADAFGRYQREVRRAEALEKDLLDQRKRHAASVNTLLRRISHATNGSTCTLGPGVVRLLNEAAGASSAAAALPGAGHSGDHAGIAGTRGTAERRLLDADGRPGAGYDARSDIESAAYAGVTEADLSAWFIGYAGRCERMEGQIRALRTQLRGRKNP